jgi:diguanylate cyclase (GGDEF)-like protein/PAS domain S-box-containing protein
MQLVLMQKKYVVSAIIAASVVFCAAIVTSILVREEQVDNLSTLLDAKAQNISTKLEERIDARRVVATFIRNELIQSERNFEAHFDSLSATAYQQLGDLQAFNWTDAQGVVRQVTPRAGNEAALDLDLTRIEPAWAALRRSAELDTLQFTAPITLAQGGRGFTGYLPVRKDGVVRGYLNLVFRSAPLIDSILSGEKAGRFEVHVADNGSPIYGEPPDSRSQIPGSSRTIEVGGRTWTILVQPSAALIGASQSKLDEFILLGGLLLALVTGHFINEASRSKSELREREERFSLAMRGASDGLFDWNYSTGECYYSPRWFQMLGYEPDELESSFETFTSLLHPEDADDVLVDPVELFETGTTSMEKEFRMRHKDGSWRRIMSRAYMLRTPDSVIRIVGTHLDITQRHERQRELERVAITDALTGLYNRRGLDALLAREAAALAPGQRLAVFHLDLDKFKPINDRYGHKAGDNALRITARRLLEHPASLDLIARVGGDEFLIAVRSSGEDAAVTELATQLIETVSAPFVWNGKHCRLGASIGISLTQPDEQVSVERLIADADIALKLAKRNGRGRSVTFSEDMRQSAVRAAEIVSDIERGLDQKEFVAHFQPQVSMATLEILGFEALARWNHPDEGLLLPGVFMPHADHSRLIESIDDQVIKHACRTLGSLTGDGLSNASVSINLSTAQLSDPTLLERLTWTAAEFHVAPGRVFIEILESTLLSERTANVIENVRMLADAGFQIALDDFGTGHTAISSLLNYPVTRIKLDRSLISNLHADQKRQAIILAMIELGERLKIEVLAEGMENEADFLFLQKAGCTSAQGYFIAHPLPETALHGWVTNWQTKSQRQTGTA